MLFNSYTFLIFFVAVLGVDRSLSSWSARKLNLLLASYLFYAAWNPPFVALIWISTVIDWFAARGIARSSGPWRRVWLVASLTTNLGLLGWFKYGRFLADSFAGLLGGIGIVWQPPELGVVLPVGISFYTFQTLSYTVDVYRGRISPWHSFLDYALYVTFFPQLVAGPIVRADQFLPQCVEPRRADAEQLGRGAALLVIGLFAKVVLADGLLAPIADLVYGAPAAAGASAAWIGTLAFSGQIFFDFSGYSACAIGCAACLGFRLPDNFRYPYAALGFSDFWRRWHVSLSSWLRDYLYISLGGNRRGPARRYANLMLTMLLGGLWHGASWSFVVWGGLHGVYLIGERLAGRAFGDAAWARSRAGRVGLGLLTYTLVSIAWVFFRAPHLAGALTLLGAMATGSPGTLPLGGRERALVLVITAALLAAHAYLRERGLESVLQEMSWWCRGLLLAALMVGLAMASGDDRAFIYFQF